MEANADRSLRALTRIGSRFAIDGRLVAVRPHGTGHIHDTFLAEYATAGGVARYIHQRLNRHVFTDIPAVMANISRVLAHLHAKGRPALTLVPTVDGGSWLEDDDGEAWRTYIYIEGSRPPAEPLPVAEARTAARAFGSFVRDLADLPGPPLVETIPHFHDTPARYAAFTRTLKADPLDRAAQAKTEIDFALAHEDLAHGLERLAITSGLPRIPTHNDTKANNVLLDAATGEALAVVDLDTVMPGLALYDFGDLVRTAANAAAEDEPESDRARVLPERFAAVATGFLDGTGGALSAAERQSLVLAGRVITFECGLRFLTDFLQGDRYFKIHRPGHNLDRCRTQMRLVASLGEREEELQELIEGSEG